MEVVRHHLTHKEVWRRPDAAGTAYTTATAKGDAQPKSPSAQPDFPRTLRVTTSTFTSTAEVAVTITGTDQRGETISETITVPAAGTTTNGSKAFAKITNVTWTTPAGWTAGTFAVESGAKLGLHLPALANNVAARKETAYDDSASPPNPADATVGTVDADNLTYTPGTALNAANVVELFATYTLHHVLVP